MPRREDYRLREMEDADLEKVLEWRNSDRIRAVMYTDQVITMEEHRGWFERVRQEQNAIYKIFEYQERPVGVVNVVRLDKRNNKCSWGFYLGEVDIPQGTGLVMGYLALEYIFEGLGIRKLCAEALAFNTPSIRFHQQLGFAEEGRLIKHVMKNGHYEDVIAMALFNEDWMKLKSRLARLCLGGGAKS
ncbi:hypothetical protein SY88_04170 [Clostridiales bacterium PH28_bin88]|nr:hypothetical protein SY88_04170 [Clostridiales bacterium PH28_bin88]